VPLRGPRQGRPHPRRRTRPTPLSRRVVALAFLASALLATLPLRALAQGGEESQPIPDGSGAPTAISTGANGTFLRLGIGLIIVVALIMAVWWVMRRVRSGRYPTESRSSGGPVGVVATTPLGPNQALHLVEVAGELVLIGATEQSITPIARIASDPSRDVLDLGPPSDAGAGLAAELESRARTGRTGPTGRTGADGGLVDRLRSLTARG